MANDTNFDRIEAFLFGQATAEEAQNLEQQAAQDAALAAEIQQQELEHRAMELMVQDELRAQMAAWKAEKAAEQPAAAKAKVVKMDTSRSLFYRIAAAAAVTLVLGFFARSMFTGSSDEAFALRSLEESGVSARSGGTDSALDPVYAAMEQKNYRAALSQLDQTALTDQTRQTAALLRGECYLRLKEYPAAIASLQQLLAAAPSDDVREKAEWLLLLAYVAEGQHTAEANALFAKILGDAGHPFHDDVQRLKASTD
jgi:tetratricopeptide (TPR) repeat protein